MILWWGKKKQPDPKTGETPIEPLKPGEKPQAPGMGVKIDTSPSGPRVSLDQQIFGNAPIAAEPDLGDDPLGIRKAAERIAAERAAEAAAREATVIFKLNEGLKRSSSRLTEGLAGLAKKKIDRESLDELEELLITSDMGAKVAARVAKAFSQDRFDRESSEDEIKAALAKEIAAILKPREKIVNFAEGHRPRIVLFVGVNGSGKTTTIGKIAAKLSTQGADIVIAAGDTFRAAAVEQLKVWAERANAAFISKPPGADAAGLAYEAVELAKKENRDLVLIDTAGRLQNKTQLMDELAKVVRAIRKIDPSAPHDVILVLDATVGQNALGQVEAFRSTAGVTGLVMTKLDGTAKGGVLVAIAEQYDVPIHFVGVGEKAEDLHPFSAEVFARALVGLDSPT
ncbi:MAG TPA: signal recognition particle-docking protein FtsY [Hyphomonadaceae bacterium]|jgi:fused signal recognition particle receptor|nr:signal recognition particle-docking protein FtsY [Hyphomonadaceae bacterium]